MKKQKNSKRQVNRGVFKNTNYIAFKYLFPMIFIDKHKFENGKVDIPFTHAGKTVKLHLTGNFSFELYMSHQKTSFV